MLYLAIVWLCNPISRYHAKQPSVTSSVIVVSLVLSFVETNLIVIIGRAFSFQFPSVYHLKQKKLILFVT